MIQTWCAFHRSLLSWRVHCPRLPSLLPTWSLCGENLLDKMMKARWPTWAKSWGQILTLILSADHLFLGSHQWMCSSIGVAGCDAEKRAPNVNFKAFLFPQNGRKNRLHCQKTSGLQRTQVVIWLFFFLLLSKIDFFNGTSSSPSPNPTLSPDETSGPNV